MAPLETLNATPDLPAPGVSGVAASEHVGYLQRMGREGVVPRPVAEVARAVWEAVRRAVPGTPVPAATAHRDDGRIFYFWDRERHHFEMEFLADGTWEWFYRDRETEILADEDGYRTADLPAEVVMYLRGMYPDS